MSRGERLDRDICGAIGRGLYPPEAAASLATEFGSGE